MKINEFGQAKIQTIKKIDPIKFIQHCCHCGSTDVKMVNGFLVCQYCGFSTNNEKDFEEGIDFFI